MSLPYRDRKWDEIRKRLAGLDSEQLAEELVEIARRSPEAADRVERLVASREENVRRFRTKFRRLKRSDRFAYRDEAADLARQLQGLLADLRMGAPEPEDGIELVAEFYRSDAAIFESCDDSYGLIGDVFRMEAGDLFAEFAERRGKSDDAPHPRPSRANQVIRHLALHLSDLPAGAENGLTKRQLARAATSVGANRRLYRARSGHGLCGIAWAKFVRAAIAWATCPSSPAAACACPQDSARARRKA